MTKYEFIKSMNLEKFSSWMHANIALQYDGDFIDKPFIDRAFKLIKSMDINELAKWINYYAIKNSNCNYCIHKFPECSIKDSSNCVDGIIAWLNSEALVCEVSEMNEIMHKNKNKSKQIILEEFNFIAGGYYNAYLDELDISEFPKSYNDFKNQIYESVINIHHCRFAGSVFINDYIDKLSREDEDVEEIAKYVGWTDYPSREG